MNWTYSSIFCIVNTSLDLHLSLRITYILVIVVGTEKMVYVLHTYLYRGTGVKSFFVIPGKGFNRLLDRFVCHRRQPATAQ